MILYYSRGNKTKTFAEVLGKVLQKDVYKLETSLDKKGDFTFILKALYLTFSNKSETIINMPKSIPNEIYICTPIWGGKIAAPIRFFLANAQLKDTVVNLLLTANIPLDKYKEEALNELNKTPCRPGNAYIFATSDKIPPEPDIIDEQLRLLLNIKL